MRALLIIFPALPLLGAAVMLIRGFVVLSRESTLRRAGTSTIGTVVDNQTESLSEGRLLYRPVLEFTTAAEQVVRAVGGDASRRSYVAGTQVALVYDPRQPSRVLTGRGTSARYFVGGTVLLAFGAFAAFVVNGAFSVLDS